ncbi:hypothetical protein N3K66_000666 [Trichothecium roseum]|uniref:Uncharacterized protein n=1 Tax=Trichothecium roseum TaxID=47278 RepID=A0ACC0VCG3_9HYPO|nr:hypothetical protein N3K66_000666 [Trichothecium roseum]
MAAVFTPRATFPIPNSIPKTYFLGHHQAGANKIKSVLPLVSLVLECRDFRLPLSTHNPHLEGAITSSTSAGVGVRERIVVYTKTDLGSDSPRAREALRKAHSCSQGGGGGGGGGVVFWDKNRPASTADLVRRLREVAARHHGLTGVRALVVGMPNVGKSTLLNALRSAGTTSARGGKKKAKAAKTGDQAGVTRKVGTAVRVIDAESASSSSSSGQGGGGGGDGGGGGVGAGVYVMDTPGIFQPYVRDGETMLKVALAHGIKKGLVADEILADYLLFRLNLLGGSGAYARYCPPTNDVRDLLAAVAAREGRLLPGGVPNLREAAARVLSLWRAGDMGRYVLDDLGDEHVRAHRLLVAEPGLSMNQARKLDKEQRKKSRVDA